MAILRHTTILLLPLLLTGCYTDFDPKLDIDPVLCINSLIKAGEPIKVDVSHTWVYSDIKGQEDHSVINADVRILANGQPVDTTYLPNEGDRIRIEANSASYGYAEADIEVPFATPVSDITYDFTVRSIDTEVVPDRGVTGLITFDINVVIDVPASRDKNRYYRLGYKSIIPIEQENTQSEVYDDPEYEYPHYPTQIFTKGDLRIPDPIFSEYVSDFEDIMGYSSLYEGAFFSDRQFEGESRPIRFLFEGCKFSLHEWDPDSGIMECGYTVILNTISKSYFAWAMYYWNSNSGIIGEFSDMGLAEPIWGYSNVSTGAGVVAAQSSVALTIPIRDFLEGILIRR